MIVGQDGNASVPIKHDYWAHFSGDLNHIFEGQQTRLQLAVFEGRRNSRKPIKIQNPQVEVSAFIKGTGQVSLGVWGLRDDGRGGDETAGDARYSLSFVPSDIVPDGSSPELRMSASYSVPVYEQPGQPSWKEGVSLSRAHYHSTAPFEFTGRFRESVEEGSLVIYAGVQVGQPGWYKLRALLFNANGDPVAKSIIDETLDGQATEVRFLFFGRVLRQHNKSTSYVLQRVDGYLFEPGVPPPRQQVRPIVDAYRTQAYQPQRFSEAEWDSAQKRRRLDMLRQVKRKGLPY